MKRTPAEQKALDTAKAIIPIPADEYLSICETPAAQRTLIQIRRLLEDNLKRAAETFEQRERSNDLYRHYLKTGDRSEARWHAPSPLLDSTQRVRRNLVEAWKALVEFERMPLAPHVSHESKRWSKSKRFFALLEIQRAIERNGGKVRHRRKPSRGDLICARVIAPETVKPGTSKHELMQLPLGV